ncbi:MAG: phosphoribosylformylglycinamidine cyclo-ligase, partial [Bdellovibrio sp.]
GIGGFAALYRLPLQRYRSPLLVSCTDGVGTKVKLAVHFQSFREVAQDCVAMCVNDLICSGAEPHLFLDYYATGKLDLRQAQEFLSGIREACLQSDCELVGGETAEMPGVYRSGDFDCAGFAVGLVEEEERLGPQRVRSGDRVLGLSSSGFHSNGFSLLRTVFEADLDLWREVLLRPTALYPGVFRELRQEVEVHAAAHITGGGVENIPRVLPSHLQWESKSWEWPEEFNEVQRRTSLSDSEMLRTLNCGVGFVLVLPEAQQKRVERIASAWGHRVFDLGLIREKP